MPKLKVIPLGGLGEIGLNMMVYETEKDIIIVDSGIMFPEDYMLGIDMVIPDIRYLYDPEKKKKIRGIVLTHGHEDHIGAIPYVLREFNIPIFGTPFTLGILEEKLKEHDLPFKVSLFTVKTGNTITLGDFEIEFIRVAHSIIDGASLAIKTPVGTIIHTGDFKLDQTLEKDAATDINRLAYYGDRGVLALFSDSTNIEKEGFTISENDIKKTFRNIFRDNETRIIVALFASNIHRISELLSLAAEFNKKVIFSGRSLMTYTKVARKLGYLSIPEDILIDEETIGYYKPEELLILTTGTQGEAMSALSRISVDDHKYVKIKPNDLVLMSSKFIPGNEKAISKIINNLYKRGAEVYYENISEIHVSGHASKEELKFMINIVKPKYFIPVHGELKHLYQHKKLAVNSGISPSNVFVLENGNSLEFNEGSECMRGADVYSGRIFVDGKGIGDVGAHTLKERAHLSENGMIIVQLVVDSKTSNIISGPDIVSKGFVFEDYFKELNEILHKLVMNVIEENQKREKENVDWVKVKDDIRKALKKYLNKNIDRHPFIFPMITEI
ncbi:MAG: ribonuclease J [Deltaproteobacteria bacterium]|jgi:ribonuclease J|uniref:Ribonuclease J n=1 Tax=Candidatus Acidulodesulfobacterium acidiphilum TaxID=2597224 RepID=A0A520XGU7_9DELT|nr:ribonuclease J [Deltaproteobacteria bacterium]RZV40404.1 MAG: ribonuclease J [Candidatus Acidulodesulfobacterium acidiphilum]